MDGLEQAGQDGPPNILGYTPIRRLGGGASASVWLMQPESGAAPVAAKCFPPQGPPSALPQNRADGWAGDVLREWRLLTTYDHQHVLPIYGAADLGGGAHALLMEYAAGGSLRHVVAARGNLSVGEAVTVLTPLAQALAYLHANSVVHGDVSPGNVLLTAQGKPLLADLGLGRVAGERVERVTGTEGFSPPADVELSTAADVYAAAAVGWYALTGTPPPPTASRPPLRAHVPDVPAELVAALEAGLSEVAAQRPTAAELAQAVYRSAPAEPVDLALAVHPSDLPDLLTRRPETVASARKWQRRRWLGWLFRTTLFRKKASWNTLNRGAVLKGGNPRRGRHGKPRRRLLLGGILAACLAACLGAGLLVWGSGWAWHAPAHTSAGQEVADVAGMPAEVHAELESTDPSRALAGLAWLRSYALESNQPDLLAQVNAAGSTALDTDQKILAQLTGAGHSMRDLHMSVTGVKVLKNVAGLPPGAVGLDATAVTAPYAEMNAKGEVVHLQGSASTQHLRFVLIRHGNHWQIWQVQTPAAP